MAGRGPRFAARGRQEVGVQPAESATSQDRARDTILRDGSPIRIRPARPSDEAGLVTFLQGLAVESRRMRFAGLSTDFTTPAHHWAAPDEEDSCSLVAEVGADGRIVANGSYDRLGPDSAEVAFVVADDWQGRGVATLLLEELARRAQEDGIETFVAEILLENVRMLDVFRASGFPLRVRAEPGAMIVEFPTELTGPARERFERREQAAAAAAVHALLHPASVELLFERFLSEERKEPPDIDIDIASDRREEAIQYVYAKYGRDHAAMVCNVICYRRRSAVREVGKTLGLSASDIDKLAKCLDHFTNDLKETEVRFAEQGIDLDDKRIKLLIELSRRLQGFPRHLGIHCGGMIVTKTPLAEIVPVENATMPNRTVVQWDKDDSADMGLVKIDLLGLGMLTLIDLALRLVHQYRGEAIDISRISYADSNVYDLLCSADTLGVFQVESRAQMNTLPRMRPRCFYDLVVEVAIIRPGPIQGKMVHPYLRRRNGEEQVSYLHPSLEPVLKRTLGIPLFQEQGIRVAMTVAGFTPAQADNLRRSIGHRQSKARIAALKESLINGMGRNGIDATTAEQIYNQLAAFADFGFAESHAASFALLVYVSAWLKVYYPVEFYCALLNAQPMGFYTPSSIVYEAMRKGVVVKNVCISNSSWECTLEGDAIRLGLSHVLSLGAVAGERILGERIREPYHTLKDFVLRTGLAVHQVEQLAQVGAFDCFGISRREALWQVLSLVRQTGYELELVPAAAGSELLPLMRAIDVVHSDLVGLSLSTGPHPMALVRDTLRREHVLSSQELRDVPDGRSVCACGMVVIRQRPLTAKGFVFITLEDETGFANIVVKPGLAKRFRRDVIFSNVLYVWGKIERKDGVVNVVGERFRSVAIDSDSIKLKSRDFH